ncbi:MAG: hypothetical protein AAGD22_09180 [Verrucomicrobiota bacterium]
MDNLALENYSFHEVLGEGSCGRVYRCSTPEGEMRAVKVLTEMTINRQLVTHLLEKQHLLPPHPGVARIYAYEMADVPLHYVTDLFARSVAAPTGGQRWRSQTIEDMIGTMSGEQSWQVIRSLTEALAHLHEHDLFHCCIKPSNLFITSNEAGGLQVAIGDLGQGWVNGARYLQLHDIPFYASPEQLRTANFRDEHVKRWDVYGFGVVSYLLLNCRLPRMQDQYSQWWQALQNAYQQGGSLPGAVDLSPYDYAGRLEQEVEISWVEGAVSAEEEGLRRVIERCLALNWEERYADMGMVREAFVAASSPAAAVVAMELGAEASFVDETEEAEIGLGAVLGLGGAVAVEDDQAQLAAEQKAKEEEEAREAAERAKAEEEARLAAEQKVKEEEEAREAAERAKAEEEARLAAEQKAKEEEEARLAAERAKVEEEARLAAEEKAKEQEEARLAAERAKVEEEARLAAEQKAKEQEEAREAAEREAREREEAKARAAAEKAKEKEEARLAAEMARRDKDEKKAAKKRAKEEEEVRKAAEKAKAEESARLAKEQKKEAARQAKEGERAKAEESARLAKEAKAKAAEEARLAKEQAKAEKAAAKAKARGKREGLDEEREPIDALLAEGVDSTKGKKTHLTGGELLRQGALPPPPSELDEAFASSVGPGPVTWAEGVQPLPPPPPRRSPVWGILVSTIVVALLGVTGYLWWKQWETENRLSASREELDQVLAAKAQALADSEEKYADAMVLYEKAQQETMRANLQTSSVKEDLSHSRETASKLFAAMQEALKDGSILSEGERRQVLAVVREDVEKSLANETADRTEEEWAELRSEHVDILKAIGTEDELLAALKASSEVTERLLEKQPGDSQWRRRLALNYRELGMLQMAHGDFSEANDSVTRALRMLDQLDRESPGDADTKFEIAVCHGALGDIAEKERDPDAALVHHTECIDALIPLVEGAPNDDRIPYQVSLSSVRLGEVLRDQFKFEDAGAMYQMALDTLRPLVEENVGAGRYTFWFGYSLMRLGELEGDTKKSEDALALLERLKEENPEDAEYRYALAQCYSLLGEIQRDAGQPSSAKEFQKKAVVEYETLIEEDSADRGYRFGLASGWSRLAELHGDANQFTDALQYYDKAATMLEQLIAEVPGSVPYQRQLAELNGNIGFANEKVGNKEKAKEQYASAVDQWEKLAAVLPSDMVERGLTWSRRQLEMLVR